MDSEAVAAREKHKARKLPPNKNPTAFQRKLASNPYALALATPVRSCQVLDVRLPRYFLQDFELMAHPETREPWWVPTSLRKEFDDAEAAPETLQKDWNFQSETPEDKLEASDLNSPLPVQTPSRNLPRSTSLGPGAYTLSRKALIASMQHSKSGWRYPPYKTFLTGSLIFSVMATKVRDKSFWRMDMDDFVLDLMRRRVVEALVYLIRKNRGYISGCVGWEDACMAKRQQAAILWTGGEVGAMVGEGFSEEGKELVDDSPHAPQGMRLDGPPEFATLTIGGDRPRMRPVYNLRKLLGLEHLAELRRISPLFDRELLTVRNKRNTLDIQMKLWRLQGYLSFSFPEIPKGERIKRGLENTFTPEDDQTQIRISGSAEDAADYDEVDEMTCREKEDIDVHE